MLSACRKDEVVPVASLSVDVMEVKVSYTTANITWNVKSEATIKEAVLEYATDSTFLSTKEQRMTKFSEKENKYTVSLDSLENGTLYYIRCRAVNNINSLMSKTDTLRTLAYKLAEVRSDSISSVTVSSAKLHATLVNWGTDTLPQVGFCVATHADVSVADSCILYPLSGTHDSTTFSVSLEKLTDNVTYYIRAFAKNNQGVSYGEELYFSTIEIVLPSVGGTNVSEISYTSALCKSNIISDGGSSVTSCGFCYSESSNPTIDDKQVLCSSKNLKFTITDLSANTTYYVRSFATNCKGTSYGKETSFKTNAYSLPTVVTNSSVTNISYTTATCYGNITADGGQTITERGFCYSTAPYPTISDGKMVSGSGLGSYYSTFINLVAGTKYYVRAYAINSVGTNYGEQIEFTTTAYSLATVTTDKVVVLDLSAACQGTISADGGSTVTERGICYSTQPNPTIANEKVVCNNGTGTFSCALSNLTQNTTYYFRAYAINSVGVSYGNVIERYTYPIGAISGEFSISASQKVVFSKGNLQYLASTKTWRFAEHQWDYVGTKNNGRTDTYPIWIDLLCWGTSNPIYEPSDNTNFYDLGNNPISNGGNKAGVWRTLSSYELDYLLNSRNNANNLKGFATIGTTHGYVLLPDNWQTPAGLNFSTSADDWTINQYSETEWNEMQLQGAVFLPCAGYYQSGTSSDNNTGCYWLSTPNGYDQACFFDFYRSTFSYTLFADILCTASIRRGHSIRLVNNLK